MGNCLGTHSKVDYSSSPQKASAATKFPGKSDHVTKLCGKSDHHSALSLKVPKTCAALPPPKTEGEVLLSPKLKAFSFSELKNATRNFRDDSLLGEGGFGFVYKGWIDEQTLGAARAGCGMLVAVKKLKPQGCQGHKEWLSEVTHLSHFHHPSLVKLIGYCSEGDSRLLVYEFMPKGSLENHLFGCGGRPLPWAIRIKVAIGAARGLSCLHDSEKQVIYRDFKASNILLDSEFNAKLSDFGLAKAGPTGDKTHVSTRVFGTHGYAAPEYILTGHLNVKCDVYGFGVVLLEILSGRRAVEKTRAGAEEKLVEWARPYLHDRRKVFRIMDLKLQGQYPKKGALMAASIASQCIGEAKIRPRMAEVVELLEKIPVEAVAKHEAKSPHSEQRKVPSPAQSSPLRHHHHPPPANRSPRGSPVRSPTKSSLRSPRRK